MSALLTTKQVAERLSISLSTVYKLCESGQLEHNKIGLQSGKRGTIRVSEEALAKFLEASRAESTLVPRNQRSGSGPPDFRFYAGRAFDRQPRGPTDSVLFHFLRRDSL